MQVSDEVAEIISMVLSLARSAHFEFVTPELLLYVVCRNKVFAQAFASCGGSVRELDYNLRTYLEKYMEPGEEDFQDEEDSEEMPDFSQAMEEVVSNAWDSARNSEKNMVELPHILHAVYGLEESYAVYYMRVQGVEQVQLLQEMNILYEEDAREEAALGRAGMSGPGRGGSSGRGQAPGRRRKPDPEEWDEEDEEEDDDETFWEDIGEDYETEVQAGFWKRYAVCLEDVLKDANPLIGREEELQRTMQVLCRRDKNNPLHIGEPGVGKTAVTYGLAALLKEGQVPEPLKGAKIYSLDLGSLLAGTQYRGDFEKRFKKVMESLSQEEKPIIYIDEIHNIVGAGAVNGGTFDVSNMLKPYLAAGHVRFIGATTYEEYKKHFEKSKSLVRRFQNIDIKEPGIQDAARILEGLQGAYEQFHGVAYGEGVLRYAVEMSAKYVNERFLPDKAIDLMDEAGAYRRMHPLEQEKQTVERDLIDEILSKTCHIPKQAVEGGEEQALSTLEERILGRVYGQDEAVRLSVNAVKFSRAGLLEDGKPLASLLFVGPTGVGKTEVARSLAEELGVKLIRFDMSEYGEKHAVAKLIGAPAGYVGYEEGGLLTEEIRKHPHAVLLLDEIEKAHPDIYNVLLQVMDYATLTDNQGRKADFRNVVIIMTSNAGASKVGRPGIGFLGQDVNAQAILEEVKRIFQPEFRNRLTRVVVFRGMDKKMAGQIVDKKLGELRKMLRKKKVELEAEPEARSLVEKKGISAEFGARQIERVIGGEVKPLLVDELLFGALKEGGKCVLTAREDKFEIRILSEKEDQCHACVPAGQQ